MSWRPLFWQNRSGIGKAASPLRLKVERRGHVMFELLLSLQILSPPPPLENVPALGQRQLTVFRGRMVRDVAQSLPCNSSAS